MIPGWMVETYRPVLVDQAVEETGSDDYRQVSAHNLRRCSTNYLLIEEYVSPRIVIVLGEI